jgi:pantoate--beta-alanine ligase
VRLASTVAEARKGVQRLRGEAREVALVPTMGALHEGHHSLVERARADGAAAVLSVFVNPLQFGPAEDFRTYPRDLERDAALCREWQVALVFAPGEDELVRPGMQVAVDPGPLGGELEGEIRPGHFRGVLTIVAKLLNVVLPDVALFGQKDLQQAVLVRTMTRDLDFPVRIETTPTVRDPDGLALSSRNAYLSAAERAAAPALYGALGEGARALAEGERRASAVRERVLRALAEASALVPEYVAVRRAEDLAEEEEVRGPTALLAAVRLGRTRLIDNLLVDLRGERLAELRPLAEAGR